MSCANWEIILSKQTKNNLRVCISVIVINYQTLGLFGLRGSRLRGHSQLEEALRDSPSVRVTESDTSL